MAFVARNITMLSNQGKLCPRVIKIRGGFPSCRCVAGVAVCAQNTAVPVLVTCNAGRAQAKQRLVPFLGNFLVSDKLGNMTIIACLRRVFPGERETGFFMFKLGTILYSDPGILAKVLLVTRHAVAGPDIKVIPALDIKLPFDLNMTRQTLHSTDFLSNIMAIRTMTHPFKFLMCPGQFTWRKLRARNTQLTHDNNHKK